MENYDPIAEEMQFDIVFDKNILGTTAATTVFPFLHGKFAIEENGKEYHFNFKRGYVNHIWAENGEKTCNRLRITAKDPELRTFSMDLGPEIRPITKSILTNGKFSTFEINFDNPLSLADISVLSVEKMSFDLTNATSIHTENLEDSATRLLQQHFDIAKGAVHSSPVEYFDVVDWRGFTESDFENLQANKKYDPKYGYNTDFYAGDLLLSITHAVHTDNIIDITPYYMKDGNPTEFLGCSLEYTIEDLRQLTYPEFQEAVTEHLNYLIFDSKELPEIKETMIKNMEKPSPESWANKHFEQKLYLAKELIGEGESLDSIEKNYIAPDKKQNLLLHGGTKSLIKKLKKSLDKDKEIKKLLFANSR